MNLKDTAYKQWLTELKTKIRSTQIKAAIAVNTELILFYWELGRMLSEKLSQSSWGDKVLETLSKDLRDEFPEMKGFSVSNLKTCKLFFEYFSSLLGNENEDLKSLISSQLVNQLQIADNQYNEFNYQFTDRLQETFIKDIVAKIPWGHIKVIITKIKKFQDAIFYIQKIKENNWSRDVLTLQIISNPHNRRGATIPNFNKTLPEALSDLAQQTLKDPYIFDFLQLSEGYKEKDIENQLVSHITKFLMELGKGFAFVGKQYHLEIADNDYYIDLLFYHIKLKCYVVIELKNTRFIPEYAGKLNFYLSAIDTLIKQEDDKPTIGILLCRDKNNIEAEFALRDINKPMGVSEFQFTAHLPENLKSSLPTIEEIENEFKNLDQ